MRLFEPEYLTPIFAPCQESWVYTDAGVRVLRELAEGRGWTVRAPVPLVSKAEFTRRAS